MRVTSNNLLKMPSNYTNCFGVSYSAQIVKNNLQGSEIRLFPFSLTNLTSLKKYLPEDATDFNVHRFRSLLQTHTLGSGLIYLREVDSTMTVSSTIEQYAPSGTLILAEAQTAGKGREQRPWVGKAACNLYFTLVLRLPPQELIKLNFAACLSIAQTCKDFKVQDVHVKWPNDVWVGYKKLSGVLINASITGAEAIAQIGIGVNVNEDMAQAASDEVRDVATSVSQCLGMEVDRESFLATLCGHLEKFLELEWKDIVSLYKTFDFLVGKKITVMPKKREDPERILAKAIGFDADGCLVIEREVDGKLVTESLNTAEVSVRPDMNSALL